MQIKNLLAQIEPIEVAPTNVEEMRAITFAAMIMAAIDFYIDESELKLVETYVARYWREEYGDQKAFLAQIDSQLFDFLFPDGEHCEYEDYQNRFLNEVIQPLSVKEQKSLLYLMKQIMEADEIQEEAELKLIYALAAKLKTA